MTDTNAKVAVVTGASQGIGAATVAAYRKLGWSVVATSRGITPSDDPGVLAVPGDITDPSVGPRVIEAGLREFGRIDTLVNNAGIFVAKPFTAYDGSDFRSMIDINLGGFFAITQPAVEAMLAGEGGHVVTITTSLTDHANSSLASALASLTKGGLNSATKALAIEYATRGVRFNAVSPGVISTPMHPAETHDFLKALHPVGRMGAVSDITDAILFLENAPFVTGEILHVDGGQSAGH
ncbi:SDR family oxidoreductase [Actinoplanes sp. Pm04-4]|uniref:SDR family oxidoreductase n=1 Tax=Paractinoplanes pyxinae TaxID=2997416 RepID=A0ABT4AWN7_9ACTN|nr:SDR family oxidoreductase [Actinoplanes pyxinae]MCY1138282.1 SDR family oxidoreductase [Actinoplanes pyxinae]